MWHHWTLAVQRRSEDCRCITMGIAWSFHVRRTIRKQICASCCRFTYGEQRNCCGHFIGVSALQMLAVFFCLLLVLRLAQPLIGCRSLVPFPWRHCSQAFTFLVQRWNGSEYKAMDGVFVVFFVLFVFFRFLIEPPAHFYFSNLTWRKDVHWILFLSSLMGK